MVLFCCLGIFFLYKIFMDIKFENIYYNYVEEQEAAFTKNPTFVGGAMLMVEFLSLKDYNKVIDYGNQTIDIGMKSGEYSSIINEDKCPVNCCTPLGVHVHLNMAVAYKNNNDLVNARKHIKKAMSIDKYNCIQKENILEGLELSQKK